MSADEQPQGEPQDNDNTTRTVTLPLLCVCRPEPGGNCTCPVREITITVDMFEESSYVGMRSTIERASDSGDNGRIADAIVQVFTDFLPEYISQESIDLITKYMIRRRLTVKTIVDTIFGVEGNRSERRAAAAASTRGSRRRGRGGHGHR